MWLLPVFFALASASSYSDSLARYKALPIAAAAYSNNPEECLSNVFTNASLVGKYLVDCDLGKGDKCFGFTAVNHNDKMILIGFRGSSGAAQIVNEVFEALGPMVPSDIGGNVSQYFYNAQTLIWSSGMKDDFIKSKNKYPNYSVLVTGHSLGGAVASLTAGTIIKMKYASAENVLLYTLGQPRVGDTAFVKAHDSLVPNSFRITHNKDIVPHIPPEHFSGYYHHKSEEWYQKEDMGTSAIHVECDSDESNSCSDGNFFDLSVPDHLHYFNKDVSTYGNNGCK
uniref:Lipase_3 domain-containing protein n=1 Tax=Panagrellus redivivus TaxID=6233 RepID=A0A7E4UNV3_PANRE